MADGFRRRCTWTGRVVYDRKPTPFTLRDVHRILSRMYWADVIVSDADIALARASITALEGLLAGAGAAAEPISGAGGQFGGGGATRPIPDSDTSESSAPGSDPGSGVPFLPAPISQDLSQYLDDDEEDEE